jgi:hypothetical protein
MLQPCFAAMLDGAVMASNPPAGLSAVPHDGSTNAATAINGIFGALPHANTNTRNVLFLRPSTRYLVDSRLDVTVHGTQVLCGGIAKITLQNTSSASHSNTDPWFRGADLSPAVRMENVEHCRWHGGGWQGRANQSGNGGTVYEMATARFCNISDQFMTFIAFPFQICGIASNSWSELCSAHDIHARDSASGIAARKNGLLGAISYRATSGKARNCIMISHWGSGFPDGPNFDEAHDCMGWAGYQEFMGGGSGYGYELLAGALRIITFTGHEGVADQWNTATGSSGVILGGSNSPGGTGDFYHFTFNS